MTIVMHETTEPAETPNSGPPLELAENLPIAEVPASPEVEAPAAVDVPEPETDTPETDDVPEAVDDVPEAVIETPGDPDARRTQLALFARISQISALAIVAVLLLVVFGVQIAQGDQIRRGVSAFGVDLSGMSRDEAAEALTLAIDAQNRQTLRLADGSETWTLSKADLGVRVDVNGVVDDAFAQGRSGWGPSRLAVLWQIRDEQTLVGGGRIAVDSDVLDAELMAIGAEIDQPKIEAVLSIAPDSILNYVPSQVGRTLNIEESRATVLAALASGRTTQPLAIDETPPLRSDDLYADAKKQLENILDAPIDLIVVDQTWTLTPAQISYWIELVQPQNGQPAEVRINEQWIWDIVDEIARGTDRDPKFPRVWWEANGALVQTRPGVVGRTLDQAAAEPKVLNAFLGKDPSNRVELPVTLVNMTNLPADMNSLGISSLVAEASTAYGESLPARMHNIELAASLLNGAIILPGQTFSFNAEVGSTSTEAGFQVAYGIATDSSGVSTVPSVGGGICQVATTVFQPVFWAGYQIDQRSTHAYWISRYESNGFVGLDATVDEASGLDFRWTNNTSTAILMEAVTDGQNFTVRLYGTVPIWRVEVDAPVVSNKKPADFKTFYEATFDLPAGSTREVEHAADGFDVSIIRRVIAGDQVSQMEFIGQYQVARNVVLVGTADGTLPAEYTAMNDGEYLEEPAETIEEPEPTDNTETVDDTGLSEDGDSSPDALDVEATPVE